MSFEKPNNRVEAIPLDTEEVINEVVEKAGPERGRGLLSIFKEVLKEKGLIEKSTYEWVGADNNIVVDIESFLDMFNKAAEKLPEEKANSDPDAEIDAFASKEKRSKLKPAKKYWWEDKD